jgi:hypothetical protein
VTVLKYVIWFSGKMKVKTVLIFVICNHLETQEWKTSIDVKITCKLQFQCFFMNIHTDTLLISVVVLFVIELYVSECPCGTCTKSKWKMDIKICRLWYSEEKVQLLFVCKAYTVQQCVVNKQKVIIRVQVRQVYCCLIVTYQGRYIITDWVCVVNLILLCYTYDMFYCKSNSVILQTLSIFYKDSEGSIIILTLKGMNELHEEKFLRYQTFLLL